MSESHRLRHGNLPRMQSRGTLWQTQTDKDGKQIDYTRNNYRH